MGCKVGCQRQKPGEGLAAKPIAIRLYICRNVYFSILKLGFFIFFILGVGLKAGAGRQVARGKSLERDSRPILLLACYTLEEMCISQCWDLQDSFFFLFYLWLGGRGLPLEKEGPTWPLLLQCILHWISHEKKYLKCNPPYTEYVRRGKCTFL